MEVTEAERTMEVVESSQLLSEVLAALEEEGAKVEVRVAARAAAQKAV